MENIWSVYIHIAPNGKVYVGATSKLPRIRWNYGYGYKGNKEFFNDIIAYGWNNIIHEVVRSGLTETQAYELEKELIQKYDSMNPQKGYNKTAGGKGSLGYKPTPETTKRLIQSHLGISVPHTKEWNENISKGNKGKKKPHVGVSRSSACRAKISKSKSKPVCQYSKDGVLIAEYPSAREAAQITGAKNQNISSCCNGKTRTAIGFIWKFKKI